MLYIGNLRLKAAMRFAKPLGIDAKFKGKAKNLQLNLLIVILPNVKIYVGKYFYRSNFLILIVIKV